MTSGGAPQADERRFVSRAGHKLEAALQAFPVDVSGCTCADFGCNVGGFTDCLLQHGAARVYAIDTGYGVLDYKLRSDDRVTVMERTNALHTEPPEPVDLVTIDLAWTPQRHGLPAALRWLRPGGRIISLVKPHYELAEDERRTMLVQGRLDPDEAERITAELVERLPSLGAEALQWIRSPLQGGKSGSRRKGAGNVEFLLLARAAEAP